MVACSERAVPHARFKRLSASLHVKVRTGCWLLARTVSFKRLSASLHVKGYALERDHTMRLFQTPFGITACESSTRVEGSVSSILPFQTPFGITACESVANRRYDERDM